MTQACLSNLEIIYQQESTSFVGADLKKFRQFQIFVSEGNDAIILID